MSIRLTIASSIGVAAVAAASVLAPAMAADSTAMTSKCRSFTDPNMPGKIQAVLGTKGGFTCAQAITDAHAVFAKKALPSGVKVARRKKGEIDFVRTGGSSNARENGSVSVCSFGVCVTYDY